MKVKRSIDKQREVSNRVLGIPIKMKDVVKDELYFSKN